MRETYWRDREWVGEKGQRALVCVDKTLLLFFLQNFLELIHVDYREYFLFCFVSRMVYFKAWTEDKPMVLVLT